MKIRLVFGFALLLCVVLIRPGSVFGSDAEEALSQATPITPNVLAVVRNQGTSLHDRPNGEPFQTQVGGTLVTARLRSQDLRWVLVKTRDDIEGWVEVRTLLAAGLSRLPVEQPTPTPTSTPEPTSETDSSTMTEATGTVTAVPGAQEDAMPTPTPSGTPEGAMESMTPEATAESMAEGATPEPTGEATMEPAGDGTPEPTPADETTQPSPTPFVPPDGPTALSLARIGGANLWRNEDGAFVAHFEAGQRLTAAYRTSESDWYFVYDDDGVHGWASADELLVVSGDSLPVEEFISIPMTETELVAEDAMDGTATPTPTPTVGEGKVVVTVINFGLRLNVRAGPGTNYEIVAKAAGGVVFNAIGRNEESNWIQVSVADLPSGYGWVSTDYVTVEGQLEQLPVVEEMESTEEGVSPPPPVFSLPLASHSLKPSTTIMA